MKITKLTQKLNSMPALKVINSVTDNNITEHYELFKDKTKVCSFDFTNYKGISGYLLHGEVKNFEVNPLLRRKPIGAKAILQSKNILQNTAKEKKIKYIMFTISKMFSKNVSKLAEHLGAMEYNIEDLSDKHYILLINPKFFKNIKNRLVKKIQLEKIASAIKI